MWIAEGRAKLEWRQTSEILALLYNANRDPEKTQPLTADDFNPYSDRRPGKDIAYTTDDLSFWKPTCGA